jgi:lysophospholipase L1-like esterase
MEEAMRKKAVFCILTTALAAFLFVSTGDAWSQHWTSYEDNTRYLALGDSLSAGYGAHPSTNGFVYQLYQGGAIDNVNNTLFNNLGVVNATSPDVLSHQLSLGALFFSNTGVDYRKVVTLTIGGNDMFQIIGGADPQTVLSHFADNLGAILYSLVMAFPDVEIYVANQYDPRLPIPGAEELVAALNNAIALVASGFPEATVVDIFGAFEGRSGLLLIEKNGAEVLQVHPTNAGYRVMTKAFADAIRGNN